MHSFVLQITVPPDPTVVDEEQLPRYTRTQNRYVLTVNSYAARSVRRVDLRVKKLRRGGASVRHTCTFIS
jgi:hypothetical protein